MFTKTLFPILVLQIVVTTADLLWSDEFDADVLDTTFWSYDLGGGGWGNFELQTYTDEVANVDVDVNEGHLKITALRQDDSSFTSGRINTQDKVLFQYGTVEASIKIPDVNEGLWAAFWTLGGNYASVGWPDAGEIDIMEVGQGLAIEEGVVNRRVVSAAHWEHEGTYATFPLWQDFTNDLNDNFHTYKLEWTPSRLATYVDDSMVWEMDLTESSCLDCEEFHRAHFLVLNLAVGGLFTSTGGSSSSSAGSSSSSAGCGSSSSSSGGCDGVGARTDVTAPLPATMLVDWVRIYDNGFTTITLPPVATLDGASPQDNFLSDPSDENIFIFEGSTSVPTEGVGDLDDSPPEGFSSTNSPSGKSGKKGKSGKSGKSGKGGKGSNKSTGKSGKGSNGSAKSSKGRDGPSISSDPSTDVTNRASAASSLNQKEQVAPSSAMHSTKCLGVTLISTVLIFLSTVML